MIQRVHLKGLLSFETVTLNFVPGLVVLSGPSGAGKSVLMGSILSGFGVSSAEAALCEVLLERPEGVRSDTYELDEELVIRSLKKERTRYYLNEQQISKKALHLLLGSHLHYLSVRESGGFGSDQLLTLLDGILIKQDKGYKKLRKSYQKRYRHYKEKERALTEILSQEKEHTDLIEFTRFEIHKIKEIDPRKDEDITLLALKKQLSKIDKLNEALAQAEAIFGMESAVSEVFALAEREGGYFWDAMNQLRADFEEMQSLAEELEETDVEALLDRLEKIEELKRRYGSIEEAIRYRETKERELEGYERIDEDKSMLERFLALEWAELSTLAGRMTQVRTLQAEKLAKRTCGYLSRLKLPEVSFRFAQAALGERGADSVDMVLAQRSTATLSGGEHNRLRLALMVASLELGGGEDGVIVLDEIDANVSGDESIAIADMIATLSSRYQIFAISHQPHLASKAAQHILIEKTEGKSTAVILDREGRIKELSRIIGGEMPNQEAVAFARKLLL